MTEINKSEVVGEKVQPEFEQYMHMPTVCGALAHYDLKPVLTKDILRLLWWGRLTQYRRVMRLAWKFISVPGILMMFALRQSG
jgi:hypothetical protein